MNFYSSLLMVPTALIITDLTLDLRCQLYCNFKTVDFNYLVIFWRAIILSVVTAIIRRICCQCYTYYYDLIVYTAKLNDGLHWRLCDTKYRLEPRSHCFSDMTVFNNVLVWMVHIFAKINYSVYDSVNFFISDRS